MIANKEGRNPNEKGRILWGQFQETEPNSEVAANSRFFVKFHPCFSICPPQVWAIADAKRQGYLGFQEFVMAMQVWGFEILTMAV